MQVSLEWLNEYVDLVGIEPDEIAHALTMSGLEVEEVEFKKPSFTNIKTAKIINIENHPNADKLHLVTLDLGQNTKRVVCGAQNIEIGQIIPYATIGSKVLDRKTGEQFELTPIKIRGVESEGMLCSQDELGLSGLQEEDGILILNRLYSDIKLNIPVEELLNIKDEVILHTAPTANRGDEVCVLGIARELSALFNRELKFKKPEIIDKKADFEVKITDSDASKFYSIAILKNLTTKPSPDFIQRRVTACGMRPINNIVDITNYVMLEYGTPQHAFDFDKLNGYLTVRYAKENEKLTTLDGVERKLTKGTSIVIATKEEPVCAGGVFGGLNSEIDDNTKNIALEGAYFVSHEIRKSSRSIGYRSDASSRYERGIDIEMIKPALYRSIELLQKYADAEFAGIVEDGCDKLEEKQIVLRNSEIKRILGIEIPQERCVEILEKLGFTLIGKNEAASKFIVPSYRRGDVEREIDLIEEISRIEGFDKVEPKLPEIAQGATISDDTKVVKIVNETMLSFGFDEIVTSSLIGHNLCNTYLQPLVKDGIIEVNNPHSEDFAILRQKLMPSMLEVVKGNFDNGQKNFRMYEIGKTYFQKSTPTLDDAGADEIRKLSGCIFGSSQNALYIKQKDDFFTLKGALTGLFEKLNLSKRIVFRAFSEDDIKNMEFIHPAQGAIISLLGQKEPLGYIGKIHPVLSDKLKFNEDLYIFELNLEMLIQAVSFGVQKYKKLPVFGSVQRDIAFVANDNITIEEIEKVIKKSADKNLFKASKVFDIYQGKGIEDGKKSFAFRITLQDSQKTLTDDVIQAEISKIKSGLEKNIIGLALR